MVSGQCTWCRFLESLYTVNMAERLKSYIDLLPPEIKADEKEHERRRAICSACPRCQDGLCGYCGCFVAARAAKKDLDCPNPGYSKWKN